MARYKSVANRWSLYPELDAEVGSRVMKPFTFYAVDDSGSSAKKEFDSFVRGTFTCNNRRCSKRGWISGKIAISIRMYRGDQYNARIHHQRCRGCNDLSRPTLDADAYGERVSYRLNKWSGFKVDERICEQKTTPPHDCKGCEACKVGRCRHDTNNPKFYECRRNCRADH